MDFEVDFYIPSAQEFRRGCELYNQKEKSGHVWFEALATVSDNWGDPEEMARGVAKLIRRWNYFYANFDFEALVRSLGSHMESLAQYRNRPISTFSEIDAESLENVFNDLLEATKRINDSRRSPVSVAKALSLLAPDFFPIWDSWIPEAYGCGFSGYGPENAARIYVRFCNKMRLFADAVKDFVDDPDDRSLLKRIDEYNFSKYTKHWI